jgi:exopolysaccharide biosynthesis protein
MTDHSITPHLGRRIAASRRKLLTGGLSFALLTAGLGGVTLAAAPASQGQLSGTALVAAQETTIGTYSNTQAKITVKKSVTGSGSNTVVAYLADVTLNSATALKSAFARNTFGRNITEPVSTTAKNNNGVLAINTDYYGFRNDGIIIRNGTSYRDVPIRQGLGILRDGSFTLYDEKSTSAAKLLAANVWHSLSFGPGLVKSGQVIPGIDKYEIGDFGPVQPGAPGSIQGLQPRTGIGVVTKNHFILMVVDGRNAGGSRGVTMPEFAQLFVDAGCTEAFNLDGGGSSTMYFNGKVINSPAFGTERATSDILYIAK